MNFESGGGASAPEAPAMLAIDGAIATITLNRPHAFNAIDGHPALPHQCEPDR